MSNPLSQLDEVAKHPDMQWVARWSIFGRGFRLHQTENPDAYSRAGCFVAATPAAALEAFLDSEWAQGADAPRD